jgi:hypothetical protein
MRLTIAAGLIMGTALGVQSLHDARLKAAASQAPSAVRVHVSAPWYVAMNPRNAQARTLLWLGGPSYPLKFTATTSIRT